MPSGTRSHYRPPGRFTKDSVRDMLTRPFYTGKNVYFGSHFDGEKVVKHRHPQEVFDGRHVPIITEKLFFQCHTVRLNRGRLTQGGEQRGGSRVYLLSGLLDCARCGAPMHAQAGGRNGARRYACSTRIQTKECDQTSVLARVLEGQIEERLLSFQFPPDWVERLFSFVLDEGGREVLDRQHEVIEENFSIVKEQYERDEIGRKAYQRAWREYQRRLRELDPGASEEIDRDAIRALLSDFRGLWASCTPLEKRGLLQTMLKHAEMDNQRIVAVEWYPPFDRLLKEGAV